MKHTFQIWLPDKSGNWPEYATLSETEAIEELMQLLGEHTLKSRLWDWQNLDVCPTDIVPLIYPPQSCPALLIDEANQGLTRLATVLVAWSEAERLFKALLESESL